MTLVELMVTLAIVAILASLAYAAYTSQVTKARRAEGRDALVRVLDTEERYWARKLTYTTNLGPGGLGLAATAGSPYVTEGGWYRITAAACPGTTIAECVALTATPQGAHAGDGALVLRSDGYRAPASHWP